MYLKIYVSVPRNGFPSALIPSPTQFITVEETDQSLQHVLQYSLILLFFCVFSLPYNSLYFACCTVLSYQVLYYSRSPLRPIVENTFQLERMLNKDAFEYPLPLLNFWWRGHACTLRKNGTRHSYNKFVAIIPSFKTRSSGGSVGLKPKSKFMLW